MLGRFNIGGSAKNGSMFPVYQQLEEPVKKTGLWVKTAEKIKDVLIANNNEPSTKTWLQLQSLPFQGNNDVGVKDGKIYIHSDTNIYEYNPKNGISTLVYTGLPVNYKLSHYFNGDFYYISVYVRSNSTEYTFYKFNVENKTQTELKRESFGFSGQCETILVGNFIYAYFTGSSNYPIHIFRYDIVNNSIISGSFPTREKVSAVSTGDYIYYLLYGTLFKYNTLTNVSTQLIDVITSNVPAVLPRLVVMEDDIYMYGGGNYSSFLTDFRKYNILENKLTNLSATPVAFWLAGGVAMKNSIYFFYTPDDPYTVYKYKFEFDMTDGIYLFLNLSKNEDVGGYSLNNLHEIIRKIWLIKNNEKIDAEYYIGNGVNWTRGG